MERKDLLTGILPAEGYLTTESGKILLAENHEKPDQHSDLILLEMSPEDIRRLAFVKAIDATSLII